MLSKFTPERSKGCKTPTENYSEHSVITDNDIFPPHRGWCDPIGPSQIYQRYISQVDWKVVVYCLSNTCWGKMRLYAFYFFARVLLCTLISFTFVISIYLTIFLLIVFITTLFLLKIYTETIEGNISSVIFWLFKFCSAPFRLFKVRITILQVFRVQFLFRNLFYKTHGYLLDKIISVRARS